MFFFGVPAASAELASALSALVDVSGLRPVRRDGLHLTQRFIGNVDDALCAAFVHALAHAHLPGAFDVPIVGLASFSQNVLFAAAKLSAPLMQLLAATDAIIDALPDEHGQLDGVKAERDARAYTPHVTLARAKNGAGSERIKALCNEHAERGFGTLRADTLTLFISKTVTGEANRYVPLAQRSLPQAANT